MKKSHEMKKKTMIYDGLVLCIKISLHLLVVLFFLKLLCKSRLRDVFRQIGIGRYFVQFWIARLVWSYNL